MVINMTLTIPDSLLDTTRMSEQEILQELAVALFAQDKLTLAQASHLAQLNRYQFQHLLASRNISIHYDVADFEEDLATLERLGRL